MLECRGFHVHNVIIVLLLASCLVSLVNSQPPGTAISLTGADIEELVDTHNILRGAVDPPASNIQALVWNEDLAAAAADFSLNCRRGSNPDRASQVPSFAMVGENWTAVGGRGQPNYTLILNNAWFSQRTLYNFTENSCSSVDACIFYTQMVWAEAVAVGCGAARCPRIPLFPVPNSVLFVCYYGPEGNIPGERPYLTGSPCSACPDDENTCIQNLCTNSSTISTTAPTTPPVTTPTTPVTTPTTPIPPLLEDGEEDSDGGSEESSNSRPLPRTRSGGGRRGRVSGNSRRQPTRSRMSESRMHGNSRSRMSRSRMASRSRMEEQDQ